MGNLMQALDIKPRRRRWRRRPPMIPPEGRSRPGAQAAKTAATEQPAGAKARAARPGKTRAREALGGQAPANLRAPERRSEVMQPVRASENKATAPTPVAAPPVAQAPVAQAPAPTPAPVPAEPQTQGAASASVEERRLTLQD